MLWILIGYSFAFTVGSPFVGGTSRFLLYGMTLDSVNPLAKTIPESVYMSFRMTFAIITPALICGAFADRRASDGRRATPKFIGGRST